MLAKLWKKVLLAICIIACIFNVMYKIVNRNSLEVNLESVNDGNTVFDFSSKKSNTNKESYYKNDTNNDIDNNNDFNEYDEEIIENNVINEDFENNIEENDDEKVKNSSTSEYFDIFELLK